MDHPIKVRYEDLELYEGPWSWDEKILKANIKAVKPDYDEEIPRTYPRIELSLIEKADGKPYDGKREPPPHVAYHPALYAKYCAVSLLPQIGNKPPKPMTASESKAFIDSIKAPCTITELVEKLIEYQIKRLDPLPNEPAEPKTSKKKRNKKKNKNSKEQSAAETDPDDPSSSATPMDIDNSQEDAADVCIKLENDHEDFNPVIANIPKRIKLEHDQHQHVLLFNPHRHRLAIVGTDDPVSIPLSENEAQILGNLVSRMENNLKAKTRK